MPNTYLILSDRNEPSFNLAAEEFLLRKRSDDYQFFYINAPSVIIGKHQNALAEINLPYLEQKNIPLYRRLSGGGTVYHDYGNVNFCFVKNGEQTNLVDFKKATEPIVQVLNDWGLPVRNGERNDLLIDFKKISGNACHVFKRRVMHHGTLLFDSDLETLTNCLRNDPLKFKDKAVKSVRSEVANIKPELLKNWDTKIFLEQLIAAMQERTPELQAYSFSQEDLNHIYELQSSKYSQNDWNYRYGPSYEFKKRSQISGFVFTLSLKVDKGKMTEISLNTNHPEKDLELQIKRLLHMKYHDKQEIVNNLDVIRKKLNISEASLLSLFF
jgi:lipoate---protein ligase